MYEEFQFEHPLYGVFKDAIYVPDETVLTDQELADIKQNRYFAWIETLVSIPVESSDIDIAGA